jgi:predicted N-formylglutamate amidohydrolase
LTGLKTERNQPYGPRDGVTHTIAIHSMACGLLNAMIEIRNDLIRTVAQQAQFAETLLGMLRCALGRLGVAMEPPVQARIDHASRH